MRKLFVTHSPLPALGMTSLVLGIIALLLAFLPVLGVPLSAIGLAFGVCGVIAAFFPTETSMRWSLAGVATCGLALGVNVALTLSPRGYLPERNVPPPWEPPPGRPSNPPPARRGDWGKLIREETPPRRMTTTVTHPGEMSWLPSRDGIFSLSALRLRPA